MAAPGLTFTYEFLELSEPSYCRVINTIESPKLQELLNIHTAFKEFLNCEKQITILQTERKILSILVYKRTGQLRREKSLQFLKRVKTCLNRISVLEKVLKLGSNINTDLKCCLYKGEASVKDFLPCQQVWTYLSYLIYRCTDLLQATMNYCVSAFGHLSCHLTTGMLIPQMMTFMATVARIWKLCETLMMKCKSLYNHLDVVKEIVEKAPYNWKEPDLPDKFEVEKPQQSESLTERFESLTESLDASIDHNSKEEISLYTETMTNLVVDDEEDLGAPLKRKMDPSSSFDRDPNTMKKIKLGSQEESKKRKKKKKQLSEDQDFKKKKKNKSSEEMFVLEENGSIRSDVSSSANKKKKSMKRLGGDEIEKDKLKKNNTNRDLENEIQAEVTSLKMLKKQKVDLNKVEANLSQSTSGGESQSIKSFEDVLKKKKKKRESNENKNDEMLQSKKKDKKLKMKNAHSVNERKSVKMKNFKKMKARKM